MCVRLVATEAPVCRVRQPVTLSTVAKLQNRIELRNTGATREVGGRYVGLT